MKIKLRHSYILAKGSRPDQSIAMLLHQQMQDSIASSTDKYFHYEKQPDSKHDSKFKEVPIVDADITDAILQLPEEQLWDLIDIRLNRPKGLQIIQQEDGQKQAIIIDANDKPSVVVRWSEECLIDELFLQLATTKSVVSHDGRCGIIVHKYYNQALALRKYVPIAKPVPKFVINTCDISTRVLAELKVLQDAQIVLKQAVGRIFENIDPIEYHMSIAKALEVVLK